LSYNDGPGAIKNIAIFAGKNVSYHTPPPLDFFTYMPPYTDGNPYHMVALHRLTTPSASSLFQSMSSGAQVGGFCVSWLDRKSVV
jgi:hypothetical protein